MTNDLKQRRVVLIYGNPGNGKSYLAEKLEKNYGYHRIGLDEVYVEFIRTQYASLDSPKLREVVGPHYERILMPCDQLEIHPGALEKWRDHVVSIAANASQQYPLVAVEGYLLLPAIVAVQRGLGDTAIVTVVEARYGQYFVGSSMGKIHGNNDLIQDAGQPK